MEQQYENLLFLKEKINEIKVALFRSEINSEVQLPNNIIQTLKVDDNGTIWFFTTLNRYNTGLIGKPFFAHLEYYKKGADCHLQLNGEAVIVDDAGYDLCAVDENKKGDFNYAVVMVKMKITQAEFYEKKTATNISWPKKIKTVFSHLFVPQHRVYNFS